MTNEEIFDYQQRAKLFNETELGNLFNRFVYLHCRAWQLDERSAHGFGDKAAAQAWEALKPVEKELREKLMSIAGVMEMNDE
jgi:hypothetical protein